MDRERDWSSSPDSAESRQCCSGSISMLERAEALLFREAKEIGVALAYWSYSSLWPLFLIVFTRLAHRHFPL